MVVGSKALLAACAGSLLATMTPGAGSTQAASVRPPSERAARVFFGERRQPIYFDDTLARQFALGISGGVEDERALPDGARFVATCRPRSCEDKAAAVIARDGRIVGAGMIGFRCSSRGDGVPPCDEEPSAFVFLKRSVAGRARDELSAWAIEGLARLTSADALKKGRRLEMVLID